MKPSLPCQRMVRSGARPCGWIIISTVIVLLNGCLSRPNLIRQAFAFGAMPISASHAIGSRRVLGIRNLQVAAPFDCRSFVYRTGEFTYERDPYAELLVSPDEGLRSPIGLGLRESGAFAAVLEPGTALKPNTVVEIYVYQLYGDFRQPESNAAVLAVGIVFLEATDGVTGKVILNREYSRRIPLKDRAPSGLMEGWTVALGQILSDATADLEQTEAISASPPSLQAGSSTHPDGESPRHGSPP
jgi:cholesterol transport system auxiliary component